MLLTAFTEVQSFSVGRQTSTERDHSVETVDTSTVGKVDVDLSTENNSTEDVETTTTDSVEVSTTTQDHFDIHDDVSKEDNWVKRNAHIDTSAATSNQAVAAVSTDTKGGFSWEDGVFKLDVDDDKTEGSPNTDDVPDNSKEVKDTVAAATAVAEASAAPVHTAPAVVVKDRSFKVETTTEASDELVDTFSSENKDPVLEAALETLKPEGDAFLHKESDDWFLVKHFMDDYYFWEVGDDVARAYFWQPVKNLEALKWGSAEIMDKEKAVNFKPKTRSWNERLAEVRAW